MTIEQEVERAGKYREEVEKLRRENGEKWLVVLAEKNDRLRKQSQLKAYSTGAAPAVRAPAAPPPLTLLKLIEGELKHSSSPTSCTICHTAVDPATTE